MVNHKHHKFFMGITAVIILIVGLLLGGVLAAQLGSVDLEVITIGLTFTSIILLLITGGLVIEIRDMMQAKKGGKK